MNNLNYQNHNYLSLMKIGSDSRTQIQTILKK